MTAANLNSLAYSETQPVTLSEVFYGFSDRFNILLDLTTLDIPELDKGRISWVAKAFETTPPSAYNWLKMDCPPLDGVKSKPLRKTSLHRITEYLLNNLDEEVQRPAIKTVLGWLRYGEESVKYPF